MTRDAALDGAATIDAADVGLDPALPACPAAAGRDLNACVFWSEPADAGTPGPRGEVQIQGTVTAITPGGRPCEPRGPFSLEYEAGWTLKVSDGTRSVDIHGLPGALPIVAKGAEVSVVSTYRSAWLWYEGATTLSAADGTLLYWTAMGSVAGLAPPAELQVEVGTSICGGSDRCGAWRDVELLASAGHAERISLAPGDSKRVGDYRVTSGASRVQDASTGCSDWIVEEASLAVVRVVPTSSAKCGGESCSASSFCAVPDASACFTTNEDGTCTARPAESTCGDACPGVCGCDGAFYCSACFANARGVGVAEGFDGCRAGAPFCAGGDTRGPDGTCTFDWPCRAAGYPSDYAASCTATGADLACDCLKNGAKVATVPVPNDAADCSARPVVVACGFPDVIVPESP